MKFNSIVLLATGAIATPSMVKRQSVTAVSSDVDAISSAATSLDSAIKAFSGISDSAALISASQAVVSAINKAQTDSAAIAETITISTPGVVAFVTQIQNLGTTVQTAITDLNAKKSQFASLGLCGEVLSQIQAQQKAASAFETTLTGKLDSSLASTAPALTGPINDALSSAASAFSSCPATTGSSSSMASGSTTTATSVATSSTGVAVTTTTGSSAPTSSCPSSTSVVVTPTVSSNVTVPPTPTVVPNTNSGVKHVAGFGGLLAAAAFAVAAF